MLQYCIKQINTNINAYILHVLSIKWRGKLYLSFSIPTPDFPHVYYMLGANLWLLLYGEVSVMVSCRQFMYLVISLLVLRAGCGIWLYQFLIIAYLFTFHVHMRMFLSVLIWATFLYTENVKFIETYNLSKKDMFALISDIYYGDVKPNWRA